MRILITGSTGFFGKYLIPKLLVNGHRVLEITRNIQKSKQLFGDKTEKFVITDNQQDFCSEIDRFGPEIVVHLASYITSNDDFLTLHKLLDANIVFFARLLDALKNQPIKLFVNTGTFAEYSKNDGEFKPAYLYAATKTASRFFLNYYSETYQFKQTTVVPYTVYGGKDSQKKIIDLIIESLNSPTQLNLSPGEQVLDFVHIDDVTDFYIKLIDNYEKIPDKSSYQIGTGKGHTLKQLALLIENMTNKKSNINWGGRSYRVNDVMYAVANTSNFPFEFNTIDLETGLYRCFL